MSFILEGHCQSKNCITQDKTDKENFIQDYCNRGERVNSTLLKQGAGAFLRAPVEGLIAFCVW